VVNVVTSLTPLRLYRIRSLGRIENGFTYRDQFTGIPLVHVPLSRCSIVERTILWFCLTTAFVLLII
jgi:hypothetical protein